MNVHFVQLTLVSSSGPMISRTGELADPIAEGGAMAKVEEDVYERAARSGLHTPEKLEWMRRNGIRPSTGRWIDRGPPGKKRPRWLAFLLRLLLGPGD